MSAIPRLPVILSALFGAIALAQDGLAQPLRQANGYPTAIGPSFDCTATHSPGAQVICSSPGLSRTDLIFVQAYYALRQEVGESGWQALKVEAVEFENRALQQCGIPLTGPLPAIGPNMVPCLSTQYEQQRIAWFSRLSAPASEEARRPIEQHITLQRDLQKLSYLPATEKIDGVYGAATRTAISAWQQSQGIALTGFISDSNAIRLDRQASLEQPSPTSVPMSSPAVSAAPQVVPDAMPVPPLIVEEVHRLDTDYSSGGTAKLTIEVKACMARAHDTRNPDWATHCLIYTFASYLFDQAVTSYAKWPPSPGLMLDKITPVLDEMFDIMGVPGSSRVSYLKECRPWIYHRLEAEAQSRSAGGTVASGPQMASVAASKPGRPVLGSAGSYISLQEQRGTLVVPVLINNTITLKFVIDSGASDVSVPADVVLTLMRAGTIDDADFLGSQIYELADGSTTPSQTFRIRSLKVGDLEIENVTASISDVKGSLLLGQSFLKRFSSWSIDNQRQVLVLNR